VVNALEGGGGVNTVKILTIEKGVGEKGVGAPSRFRPYI